MDQLVVVRLKMSTLLSVQMMSPVQDGRAPMRHSFSAFLLEMWRFNLHLFCQQSCVKSEVTGTVPAKHTSRYNLTYAFPALMRQHGCP